MRTPTPPPSSILLWHADELREPPAAPCCLRTTRAGSRAAVYRTGPGGGVAGFVDFTTDARARPEGGFSAEGVAHVLSRPLPRAVLLADDVLAPVFRHLRGRRALPPAAARRLVELTGETGGGGYPGSMQIDKNQILELLRNAGDQGKADQADQELPQQVDTDQHASLLQKLGIDPADLLAKLGGGGGLAGGLGGMLGGR